MRNSTFSFGNLTCLSLFSTESRKHCSRFVSASLRNFYILCSYEGGVSHYRLCLQLPDTFCTVLRFLCCPVFRINGIKPENFFFGKWLFHATPCRGELFIIGPLNLQDHWRFMEARYAAYLINRDGSQRSFRHQKSVLFENQLYVEQFYMTSHSV